MNLPKRASAEPPQSPVDIADPAPKSRAEKWFAQVAAGKPKILYLAWAVVALAWIGSFSLVWVCWLIGRDMWAWTHGELLRMVPAILGTLILLFVPVWGWMGAAGLTRIAADSTFASDASAIAAVHERVRETEEDALNRLETTDQAGLLPLLRYSRAQLDAYYAMGLAQTRRSFVNAVIAMWLGFAILLAGIALYIGPVEQIGIHRPSADFKLLILSSAAIVELISALFLWVYRSTIGQLTFYYRLQMHSHTAILCFRISDTMEKSDEAKRAIVDRLLDTSVLPERPAASASRGLLALLSRQ